MTGEAVAGAGTPDVPILMVAFQYPPEGGSSGVLRTLKFSKYLPQFGYRPHVLTLRKSFYRTRDESLMRDVPPEAVVHRTFALDSSRHLAVRGRHLAMLAVPDPYVSWLPFGVARGLGVIRRHGIRCLYSTSPPPTTHLIAGCLRRLTRIPWVADFRDPWIEEGLHPRPGTVRDRFERNLERWVLRTATRVTVTTPRLRSEILERHPDVPPEKVRVVYNGFDEGDFAEAEPADAPAPSTVFEILHAGLVTPEFRDPLPLLRILAELGRSGAIPLADVRFTLLGGGSYVVSEEFRSQVDRLGLREVVDVVGRVPHSEALRRQRGAAVLLLLQASEDTRSLIPAKAFEYLRLGRPVLALTLDGDTADLLNGMEQCHVVDPEDTPRLRSAVLELHGRWRQAPDTDPIPRPVERFERRRLTRELADILHEISA